MTLKIFTTFLILFLLSTAFAVADIIQSNSFQASSDGANVVLRWVTQDETNVQRFEIERQSGVDGGFAMIGTVVPKGTSAYEFTDFSALRKSVTIYQYRIKIVFSNGSSSYVGPITVSHTVSGVRRTWGSIKAMFR